MNRLDLIIKCMDEILNDELPSPEKMMTAYRYAHELRALKPVAWGEKLSWGKLEGLSFDKQPRFDTPLYALNEVTK